jgi:hypothetical protein
VTPRAGGRIIEPDFGETVMRVPIAWVWLAGSSLTAMTAAAEGLAAPDGQALWPQWQARLEVDAPLLLPVSLITPLGATPVPGGASRLLGDFYFDAPGLRLPASMGGLRATSGLVSTIPYTAAAFSGEAIPYLGVGYTGLSLKNGWGFTADLGMALENPGSAARAGRALFGNQGFDQALRELRLSPMLQVGVSYTF